MMSEATMVDEININAEEANSETVTAFPISRLPYLIEFVEVYFP